MGIWDEIAEGTADCEDEIAGGTADCEDEIAGGTADCEDEIARGTVNCEDEIAEGTADCNDSKAVDSEESTGSGVAGKGDQYWGFLGQFRLSCPALTRPHNLNFLAFFSYVSQLLGILFVELLDFCTAIGHCKPEAAEVSHHAIR